MASTGRLRFLCTAVLLITGGLIQRALVRDALAARQRAERSEAALRENEMKYRTLAENLPFALQVLAPTGETLQVNKAWERLWQTPFEALGDYNVFQDQQLKELGIQSLLARAVAGETVEIPVHEYDKAGTPEVPSAGGKLWVRAFAYPLHGADGSLKEVVLIHEDVTERQLADEQIRNLAYFDALTRLPNRRLLMDRLGHALHPSNRHQGYGALLILDLDHFKALNDTQGHDVGDELLVEVAARLKATVRQADTVSRLGGDEYVVVAERLGTDEQIAATQAELIAEKVRNALQQPYRLSGGRVEHHSSASIGMTLFRGTEITAETLLKQADVALYQAKDAGRNAIRFFNPAMQATIDARAAMIAALRVGLEKSEFQLFYQPQVDQRGTIVGAETLLRWQSATRGTISPTAFVPLAEETGLIMPIGNWVLDSACALLQTWEADPRTRDLHISVNVSARQFHLPDFAEQVEDTLRANRVNPRLLTLELTEGVVLDKVDNAISTMMRLAALGVEFSLDDFGTGYSSLSYLKRLPLNQLKIDQSFVRDIEQDPNDAAIVRAILAMSGSLGILAIAEGVETEGQRNFLMENGCVRFQGNLFGRPMPAEELNRQWQ
jgi:diguanylate cyclase (GGDEF)-like protein/PAS domain S-box-containing protein